MFIAIHLFVDGLLVMNYLANEILRRAALKRLGSIVECLAKSVTEIVQIAIADRERIPRMSRTRVRMSDMRPPSLSSRVCWKPHDSSVGAPERIGAAFSRNAVEVCLHSFGLTFRLKID